MIRNEQDERWSQPIRKPKEITATLIKICQENDERAGQAIQNALWAKYGDNNAHDIFGMEDSELLDWLQEYYTESKRGNSKVRKRYLR